VWLAALLASFALPAYSVLAPRNLPESAPPAAVPFDPIPAVTTTPQEPPSAVAERLAVPGLQLPDFSRLPLLDAWHERNPSRRAGLDGLLIALWIASSTGVLGFYGVALAVLYRASRRWPTVRLEHGDVLVSERLGPAIFGFFRPRIVVPRWLLGLARDERALVLRHERAHAAARDPLLLAAALLLVTLAPWNPVLWWQWWRLRVSTELDCDARVVRGGANPIAYSEALLAIRARRSATPLAAAALAFAYALTPPALFAQNAPATTVDPLTGMTLGGDRVVILVDTSASMLDDTLVNILRRRSMPPEARRAAPKWRQVVNTVERLTTQIAPGTQVQVIGFAEQAASLIADSNGQWVTVTTTAGNSRTPWRRSATRRRRAPRACMQQSLRCAALSPGPTTCFCSSTACRRWVRSGATATASRAASAWTTSIARFAARLLPFRSTSSCSPWKATRGPRRSTGS
jgi:hypothetical protein